MTLGRGRSCSSGKLGHHTRIKEKVRGDVRVSHLCASEFDGVGIAGMYDVKFSPEHAVDDGAIFHTCHIDVIGGGNRGFKRDMLSWDEFEVERSRHFCDWRGTGRSKMSLRGAYVADKILTVVDCTRVRDKSRRKREDVRWFVGGRRGVADDLYAETLNAHDGDLV